MVALISVPGEPPARVARALIIQVEVPKLRLRPTGSAWSARRCFAVSGPGFAGLVEEKSLASREVCEKTPRHRNVFVCPVFQHALMCRRLAALGGV